MKWTILKKAKDVNEFLKQFDKEITEDDIKKKYQKYKNDIANKEEKLESMFPHSENNIVPFDSYETFKEKLLKMEEDKKHPYKFPKTEEEYKDYYLKHPESAHEYVYHLIEEMGVDESAIDNEILEVAKKWEKENLEKIYQDEEEDTFTKRSADQPTTPKPTSTLPDNMIWAWDPKASQWIAVMKDNPTVTPPTYNPNNINNFNNTSTAQTYTSVKSSLVDCLNKFLNNKEIYSKEVKLEKGLLENEFIKYAGFNPLLGTKYIITDKGLQFLKNAAQNEFAKELKEKTALKKKAIYLDGVSESKIQTGLQTDLGKMPNIKKFSIFEINGEELAKEIEAKDEIDAKVKFFINNPEYENSKTIKVKEVDSSYSETTQRGLDYPNQSVSPSDDITVDTQGWVNKAEKGRELRNKVETLLDGLNININKVMPYFNDDKILLIGDLDSLLGIENAIKERLPEVYTQIMPQFNENDYEKVYKLEIFTDMNNTLRKFSSDTRDIEIFINRLKSQLPQGDVTFYPEGSNFGIEVTDSAGDLHYGKIESLHNDFYNINFDGESITTIEDNAMQFILNKLSEID